jgi:hypothetical protein
MSQDLIVVARKPQPKRERHEPELWPIHLEASTPVEVHLSQGAGTATEWIPLEAFDGSLTW